MKQSTPHSYYQQPQAATSAQPQAATSAQPQAATSAQPQAANLYQYQATDSCQPQATDPYQPQGATSYQYQTAGPYQVAPSYQTAPYYQGMPPYQATPYYQAAPAYPSAPIKQPSGWGKFWAALALAFAVLIIQVIGFVIGMLGKSDMAIFTVAELAGALAALLFVFALGGKKLSFPSFKGMGETWRILKWIFIADIVAAIIDLIAIVASGDQSVSSLWPLRVLLLLLLCTGVGVFEESLFRGLILHGLLSRMGTNKKGVFWAIILSSIAFGLLHIDPTSMSFTDPSQLLQAMLKVLQTGIFGFVAAVIVLRTGNIWPIAFMHGLNDFMLMVVSNGITTTPINTQYVVEGGEGLQVIAIYIVLCLAYLPSLIVAWRTLKEHPVPDRGQFYRARS